MTSKEANEFLRKAENYLKLAENALSYEFFSETCFLSSISSELAIKGLSIALVSSYPTTHDLRQLLNFIFDKTKEEKISNFIKENREKLNKLTKEYFISRYNLGIEYEKEDAEDCIRIANEVFRFVRELLSR